MAMVKTKSERAKVAEACKITDQIFTKIIGNFKFKTEIELRDFILAEIKKKKVTPSFPPIVTSGPRAGNEIHPQSTSEQLEGFVIVDFGVTYKKYMSDMTRTVYVGKPSTVEKNLYALVLRTQEEAAAHLLPGNKCAAADAHARSVLGRYKKYFIHTLGHGVGTRIHEAPRIFFKRTRPYVREGMVLTVEPGVYLQKRLGIRIEDTYEITQKGPHALTRSPKQLFVFPQPKD